MLARWVSAHAAAFRSLAIGISIALWLAGALGLMAGVVSWWIEVESAVFSTINSDLYRPPWP